LVKDINLAVRFLMELCVLASLGYWGYWAGNGLLLKWVMVIGAPLVAAIVWGMFVAPKASIAVSGWMHLLLEFLVFAAGVLALYKTNQITLSIIMAIVIILNKILLIVWKQ
jgi:hypothetical protein